MKDKLLHRYLNNEISEEEMIELQSSEEYRDYLKIAAQASQMQAPSFDEDTIWQNIKAKRTQAREPKVVSFNFRGMLKYAAVLAVIIVSGFLYVNSLETMVSTSIAEKTNFNLPDNSEVALNASSSITYKKSSWNKERMLNLDGEAYFKVTPGSTFEVKTNHGSVMVVGTEFNVKNRNGNFEVKCFEGKVNVTFNNEVHQLTAGTGIMIQDGILIEKEAVYASLPDWMQKESQFKNTNLTSVIKELERQYEVSVSIDGVEQPIYYTGTFPHDNLNSALRAICSPLKLQYEIIDNKKVIIKNE